MKLSRHLTIIALPVVCAAVLYSQLSSIGMTKLLFVRGPEALHQDSGVELATADPGDIIDVKTWDETARKSGRRR